MGARVKAVLRAEQGALFAEAAPPPPPSGGITPRPYQEEGLGAARRIIAEGAKRILLVLATGGGKTVIAALVALGAVGKGKRVLFVGPRREIIAQAFWKLVESGIPELSCGVIMADGVIPHAVTRQPYDARRPHAPVQVASVQTLANRKLPPADVVFIDEAHHATSETWAKTIKHYTESGAVVVGLTATPCRADGAGLGKWFDRMHVIAGFADLAAQGFLVEPRVFTTPHAPDLSKVKLARSGEYDAEQLAATMRAKALVGDVVEHWRKHAEGRTTVVFAASVEHSRELRDAFRAAGVAADHIDANTDPQERDAALARLARGESTVLCNMGVCLDAETEILTSDGWVGIDAMSESHLVANWDDGRVTFERPLAVIRRDRAPGERMVRFSGKRLDVRVTEDHDLLYRTTPSGRFLKKPARDLVGGVYRLPVSGVADPMPVAIDPEPALSPARRSRRIVQLRHLLKSKGAGAAEADAEAERRVDRLINLRRKSPAELTADECRFIGFWLGDGTRTNLASGGVEYSITQSERYTAILAWLDGVVARMGVSVARRTYEPKAGFATEHRHQRWSFARGTGGGDQERVGLYPIEPYLVKDGSPLFWGFNAEQFDALIEGLWMADGEHGDGSPIRTTTRLRIVTVRRALADLIQAIAVTRGYVCSITRGSNPDKNPKFLQDYRINLKKSDAFHIGSDRFHFEEGWRHERVWCVRTRSGNIITRRNGRVLAMGNCTEGWDLPRCKCVVLARPTKSLSLFLQMAGRGLRPWQGVSAILLDHAGAVHEHGLPSDEREWSLDGKVRRKKAVAVRTCPKCYAALPAATRACTECGHVFPDEERAAPESVDGELVEATAKPKPTMDERVAWYGDALADAAKRGRKVGFARHRYREYFGGWPRGPRLAALEREHYPAAPPPPSAEPEPVRDVAWSIDLEAEALTPEQREASPFLAAVADALAAPRPRARRINLDALAAPPAAAPAEPAMEVWTL